MEVVEVLSVDEEVEHVVALAEHLEYSKLVLFSEIKDQTCRPASTQSSDVDWKNLVPLNERKRYLQGESRITVTCQISYLPSLLRLRRPVLERVQHEHLEQLLVRDANLHGHA